MKHAETLRSGNRTLDEKREAAAAHAAALTWTAHTGDIKGATILLVDDVFTSGSQLRHVARRHAGQAVPPTSGGSLWQESPGADDLTVASGPIASSTTPRVRGADRIAETEQGTQCGTPVLPVPASPVARSLRGRGSAAPTRQPAAARPAERINTV